MTFDLANYNAPDGCYAHLHHENDYMYITFHMPAIQENAMCGVGDCFSVEDFEEYAKQKYGIKELTKDILDDAILKKIDQMKAFHIANCKRNHSHIKCN